VVLRHAPPAPTLFPHGTAQAVRPPHELLGCNLEYHNRESPRLCSCFTLCPDQSAAAASTPSPGEQQRRHEEAQHRCRYRRRVEADVSAAVGKRRSKGASRERKKTTVELGIMFSADGNPALASLGDKPEQAHRRLGLLC